MAELPGGRMQLELGKRGDYAIRAVLDIARHYGTRRKAREISSRMSIPQKYLSRILAELVRAGVLHATAGQDGGYELVASPESVTLLEVIEAVEGPTELRECLLRGTPCNIGHVCSLHQPWVDAEEAMLGRLRGTTFAELSGRTGRPASGTPEVIQPEGRQQPRQRGEAESSEAARARSR